jgi:ketosteroid isomerase-like protein
MDKLELVRRLYEAMSRGERGDEFIAEDAEYVNPTYAVEPGTRPWRDARERLRETYADYRVEVDELIDAGGDDVVVLGRYTASGPSSGVPLAGEHGYIWTVRDGKGVRFRWFGSHAEALEAAGVAGRADERRH